MPGPQVKRWDIYEALRRQGKSEESAARIANSQDQGPRAKAKGKAKGQAKKPKPKAEAKKKGKGR